MYKYCFLIFAESKSTQVALPYHESVTDFSPTSERELLVQVSMHTLLICIRNLHFKLFIDIYIYKYFL